MAVHGRLYATVCARGHGRIPGCRGIPALPWCRWAGRGAVGYQQLAEDGFAVLGERLRSAEERAVVAEVLEKVLGAKVRRGLGLLALRRDCVRRVMACQQGGQGGEAVVATGRGKAGLGCWHGSTWWDVSASCTRRLFRCCPGHCSSTWQRRTSGEATLRCSSCGQHWSRRLRRLQRLPRPEISSRHRRSTASSSSSAARTAWLTWRRCAARWAAWCGPHPCAACEPLLARPAASLRLLSRVFVAAG